MQAVPRMRQKLLDTPAIEQLQIVSELLTHQRCWYALLSRRQLVVLRDVVALQALQGGHRIVQTGGGHAPGTNRCANQMHGLRTL